MDYLGLGPDEAYYDDEFDEEYEPVNVVATLLRGPGHLPTRIPSSPTTPVVVVRCSPVVILMPLLRDASHRAMIPGDGALTESVKSGIWRTQAIRPARFDQAQEVADTLKRGQPVIMNLDACERDVASIDRLCKRVVLRA